MKTSLVDRRVRVGM